MECGQKEIKEAFEILTDRLKKIVPNQAGFRNMKKY